MDFYFIGFNCVVIEMLVLSTAIPVIGLTGVYVKNRWFPNN